MNTEHLIFSDEDFSPSRFEPLPKKLNGHRLAYKGKAPRVRETKQEQALAEIASKKMDYYNKMFQPLENAYMSHVDSLDTDGARNFVKGTAANSVTAKFDEARGDAAASLENHGVNPNSGKFKSAMSGLTDAEAGSSADGKARALNGLDDSYAGGLGNIAAIGRGQSTIAQAGLSDLAHSAASKAGSDAENSFNNTAALSSAVGTVAGGYAYGSYGKPDGKPTGGTDVQSKSMAEQFQRQ